LDVGQDLDPYQLSDRIVMSPFTAKRLVILLNNIIEECESKYGSLDMKPSPANGPDQDPVHRPDFSETRRSDEKVDLLLKLVKNLNIELGLERSFKISEKTVLGNRFLLGTSKSAIRQRPDERILHICERMEMPGNLLEASRENLSDANYIHFGLEGNLSSCIYYVIKY
jgi:hypothetical protein